MSLTPINTVTLGTAIEKNNRNNNLDNNIGFANTFNTPASGSFNTIQLKKVIGANSGDVLKLSIYKGTIPDDPDTADDDIEDLSARIYLDDNDFIESSEYTVQSDLGSSSLSDVQFDFDTNFDNSAASLGLSYTVLFEQFDTNGMQLTPSEVFCEHRSGVSNYVNPQDYGFDGSFTSATGLHPTDGGVGNFYYIFRSAGDDFGSDYNQVMLPMYLDFTDGVYTTDPVMPIAIFSRPVSMPMSASVSTFNRRKVAIKQGISARKAKPMGPVGSRRY